mmetsp:Transcript_46672/g.92151  ORF Transcript_46672/g.92151 Transcript_46672/m.92151 type:complete len:144 (+) Transcript_46672:214-645(+)
MHLNEYSAKGRTSRERREEKRPPSPLVSGSMHASHNLSVCLSLPIYCLFVLYAVTNKQMNTVFSLSVFMDCPGHWCTMACGRFQFSRVCDFIHSMCAFTHSFTLKSTDGCLDGWMDADLPLPQTQCGAPPHLPGGGKRTDETK